MQNLANGNFIEPLDVPTVETKLQANGTLEVHCPYCQDSHRHELGLRIAPCSTAKGKTKQDLKVYRLKMSK